MEAVMGKETLIEKLKKAHSEGLLFLDETYGGHEEAFCDWCGKKYAGSLAVIHTSKEMMEADPCSGQAFLFGSTCWKKIKKELGR
jgi:hypothetical protein